MYPSQHAVISPDLGIMIHGCSSHDAWGRSLGPRINTVILRESHPTWLPLETPAHCDI
jgi:hypothetical protein